MMNLYCLIFKGVVFKGVSTLSYDPPPPNQKCKKKVHCQNFLRQVNMLKEWCRLSLQTKKKLAALSGVGLTGTLCLTAVSMFELILSFIL